jgi:ribosomal-protein-alanine N-acetyltransferase
VSPLKTVAEMAALHARAFATPRPWSAAVFEALLASDLVFAEVRPGGLALCRVVADEAELLTIAVDPDRRRQGIGRALIGALAAEARARQAGRLFLEVAADNPAAIALYRQAGFAATGRRPGYYRPREGPPVDAILMEKPLTAE